MGPNALAVMDLVNMENQNPVIRNANMVKEYVGEKSQEMFSKLIKNPLYPKETA